MHTLDIIASIITVIFIIIGIKRGFIIEIFRLIAMIGGFIIAFIYYKDLLGIIPLGTIPLQVKGGVTFLILYIITALLLLLIGWAVKKLIHISMLGWADRLLGACIGSLKALMIAWVACLSIASFSTDRVQNNFSKSFTYKYYKKLPSSLELDGLTKFRDTIRKLVHHDTKKAAEKK